MNKGGGGDLSPSQELSLGFLITSQMLLARTLGAENITTGVVILIIHKSILN